MTGPPRHDPDPSRVVITRFECRTLIRLLLILALHHRIKRDVRRKVDGFVDAAAVVLWRRRTILSVTLWEDLEHVYGMGGVRRHIGASRVPHRLGVRTTCGVYTYTGDWRTLMFGTPTSTNEPLHGLRAPAPSMERD